MNDEEHRKAVLDEALRRIKENYEKPDEPSGKTRNQRRLVVFTSTISLIAGSAAVIGALGSTVIDHAGIDPLGSKGAAASRNKLDNELISQIAQLKREVTDLKREQAAVAQPASPTENQSKLVAKIDALQVRQIRLEQAILNNPEKALTLPLMRRDIDNMRESNTQSLAFLKSSVDQVYDLAKWLLGALGAGVISLAVNQFLTRRP